MKPLPSTIVIDTTVLISAVLGRTGAVIERVQRIATLITTDRAVEEGRRKIELGLKAPELLPLLDAIAAPLLVVPLAELEPLMADAGTVLRDAAASGNGSTRDAHVLALAWCTGADVWSADRDFAGSGVASWSTRNLVRAMGDASTSSA
ncbi:MAG TPA: PIN domain-containing protein [Rhizomicrobium sp.]|nr:PIN domain-containing protein [Rhizomicrobium sp.]